MNLPKSAVAVLVLSSLAVHSDEVAVEGGWRGSLVTGAGTELAVDLVVRAIGGGHAAYLVQAPWPNVNGGRANAVTIEDRRVRLAFERLGAVVQGTVADGVLDARWTQPGTNVPLRLSRYARPLPTAAEAERLSGVWAGTVGFNGTEFEFALRFALNDLGEMTAVIEHRTYGAETEAASVDLSDGVRFYARPGFEVLGAVSGEAFIGELHTPMAVAPLTLAKEAAEP
ncbi:MAG: hypothetical protein OXH15_04615 [Gammaproteobacteria bacterium]|nr:hypothetical protein [Gammaproteobacteria bacterium]